MTGLATPARPEGRVQQLDVLRGIAILGILMVNAPSFAMPGEILMDPKLSPLPFEAADQAVWWTMSTFFQGKFVALFSLLFGVSLFLVGGERDDPVKEPVLVRRLIWLAVFGVLHGTLIWFGDILLHYAAVGFMMFLFRSWGARKLITVGLIWLAGSSLFMTGFHALMEVTPAATMERGFATEVARALRGYPGDLGQVQAAVFSDWAALAIASVFLYGPQTLGLMMLGLGLYKAGVLQGGARTSVYLALAAAGAAALVVIGLTTAVRLEAEGSPLGWVAWPNTVLAPVVTLGYVAAVVLALKSGAGRAVGRVFAPVGRMAFTNYLTQSLIMTTIFYGGRGLGWYGRLDWADWIWIVLGVWAVQLAWSPLWLSRFTMGPFEWIWRRLSYGRPIPLRRSGALERAAVPAA